MFHLIVGLLSSHRLQKGYHDVHPSSIPVSFEVGALLAETSTLGFYIALFCASLHALSRSMKEASNRWLLMSIAIVLFLLITLHWILQVVAAFGIIPCDGDPILFPAIPFTQTGLYIAVALLADCMFTHRLFLVWGRNWLVIIFPIMSMLGAPLTLISLKTANVVATMPNLITYVATLVTNVYITAMISLKIWRTSRAIVALGHPGSTSVIMILIESAGIYTLSIVFTIAAFWTPLGQLTNTMVPVIGITYSLLIVLVARGRDSATTHQSAISSLAFRGHGPSPSDISDAIADTRADFNAKTYLADDLPSGGGTSQIC